MFPGPVPLETISAHPVAKDGISLSTAIHGIVHTWQGNTQHLPRVRHIEGHCNNIHKGRVRIRFWVDNCQHGVAGDAFTTVFQASRSGPLTGSAELRKCEHQNIKRGNWGGQRRRSLLPFFFFPAALTFRVPFTFAFSSII